MFSNFKLKFLTQLNMVTWKAYNLRYLADDCNKIQFMQMKTNKNISCLTYFLLLWRYRYRNQIKNLFFLISAEIHNSRSLQSHETGWYTILHYLDNLVSKTILLYVRIQLLIINNFIWMCVTKWTSELRKTAYFIDF